MNIRDKLRLETAPFHVSIERNLALLDTVKTREKYVALLERFYGFYVPIESALSRYVEEFQAGSFDLASRYKSRWIAEDLIALGHDRARLSRLRGCESVPHIANSRCALGCLYVLEGSTLGGQVIARHFKQALEITPANGGRFFHGYGTETGKMWKSFLDFLNVQGASIRTHEFIVKAACETFEILENWLVLNRRTREAPSAIPEAR